jgi:acylphosphatase
MTNLFSLQATVYGRVQGVFFRDSVTRCARELGLVGYVRNMPDGTLEVRAEGERKPLEKLVDYLGVGPPAARVDKVAASWFEYTGEYSGFHTKY